MKMENSDVNTTIEQLKLKINKFVTARNWSKFHTSANLAKSICVESAELLEVFQWSEGEQCNDPVRIRRVKEELADVLIYSLSMANVLNLDIAQIVVKKLKKNEEKYPMEQYKGKIPQKILPD